MILFGAVQIVLCLIPDFHEMAWLSILAAIMSFAYSSIGFGLGLAKVIGTPIVFLYMNWTIPVVLLHILYV